MKILIVAPYFYPKAGGLEHYAYQIAKGLQARGHQICITAGDHTGAAPTVSNVGGLSIHYLHIDFKLSNTPIGLSWPKQLRALIADEQPDCILAHSPVPFAADVAERVRGNVPFVLTYHNDLVKAGYVLGLLAKTAYALGMQKTLNRADAIMTTSKFYAERSPYLARLQNKVNIVPPGVDLQRFNPAIDRQWLKQTYGERFTVLFVGQLDTTHDHKGLGVLLQAMSLLARQEIDMQLIVVGRGNGAEAYKAQAEALDVRAVFAGYVSDDELPRYNAGADVLVLPSVTDAEGFGMVLLEANACGRPVIGSRIGGIPQAIIDHETGLLVQPTDAGELANALLTLQRDPELAKRLGEAGAARVQNEFGWEQQVAKTEAVLQRVIAVRKGDN